MESYEDLRKKFFSGELPEDEIIKVMKIYERLKLEEKNNDELKLDDKHLDLDHATKNPDEKSDEKTDEKKIDSLSVISKSGLDALSLKSTKFYVDNIGISQSDFAKPRKLYEELGPYDFEGETYLENLEEKIDTNENGIKYYFVGQLKDRKRHGVGITVEDNGYIHQGYYKDDIANGPGRAIWPHGGYYIGDWKYGGDVNVYGEFHFFDGKVYKGYWLGNNPHGQGTMTLPDGTSYTGIWENGAPKR